MVEDVLERRSHHSLRVCTATRLHRLHISQRVFPLPAPAYPRPRRGRGSGHDDDRVPVVVRFLCGERQGVLLLNRRCSFEDIAAAVLAQSSLKRCSELSLGSRRLCCDSGDVVLIEDGAVLEVGE